VKNLKRTLSLLLAILLLSFILYLHLGGPANPFPDEGDYPFTNSRQCRKCHFEIYEEWRSSFHALSYKDRLVKKLSKNFREVDCISCHAPRPLLLSDIPATPIGRENILDEGVSCLSCHRTGAGAATASRQSEGPCRPVQDGRISTVELCKCCHNIHGTVNDWEKTPLKLEGRNCISCHMPFVKRNNGKQQRTHNWHGGHSKEMVAKAVQVSASLDKVKNMLIVETANIGAGHNVPTELRHRSLDLEIVIKKGWLNQKKKRYSFRNPYKGEGGENTQLKFGEKRQFTFELPEGKGEAEIKLIYRYMPYGEGSDGEVIQKIAIPFN